MTIKIKWTFNVVSPESCEHGDFERTGFACFNGINGEECGEKYTDYSMDTFHSAKEAANAIETCCGSVYPSISPLTRDELKHFWLSGIDGSENYSNGENTRYDAHPSGPNYQIAAMLKHLGVDYD